MAHFGKKLIHFSKEIEMKCTVFLFFRARIVNLSFFTFSKKIFNAHFKPQWRKSWKVSVIRSFIVRTSSHHSKSSCSIIFAAFSSSSCIMEWHLKRRLEEEEEEEVGSPPRVMVKLVPGWRKGKEKARAGLRILISTQHEVSFSQFWKIMSWMDLIVSKKLLLYIVLVICGQQSWKV